MSNPPVEDQSSERPLDSRDVLMPSMQLTKYEYDIIVLDHRETLLAIAAEASRGGAVGICGFLCAYFAEKRLKVLGADATLNEIKATVSRWPNMPDFGIYPNECAPIDAKDLTDAGLIEDAAVAEPAKDAEKHEDDEKDG